MSVVIFNELSGTESTDVRPSYVVCREIGRISFRSNNNLIDEYTQLDKIFGTTDLGQSYRGSLRLYNLTRGGGSFVFPWVTQYDGGYNIWSAYKPTHPTYTVNTYCFTINNNVPPKNNDGNWLVGDAYGVEAAPVQTLPRGFLFGNLNYKTTQVLIVTFLPDGRLDPDSNSVTSIRIEEDRAPKKSTSMTVASDGSIKYNEDWN